MRADDFNTLAMEQKILNNLNQGFTIKSIKLALLSEQIQVVEQMKPFQIRSIELSDQIDYMNEKYPLTTENKNEEKDSNSRQHTHPESAVNV